MSKASDIDWTRGMEISITVQSRSQMNASQAIKWMTH